MAHGVLELGPVGRRRRARHAQLRHPRRAPRAPPRSCRTVARSRAAGRSTPSPGPANPYPARHMVAMQDSGAMCDHLSLFIHGFTETHLDALCHLPVGRGRRHLERPAARPVRHAASTTPAPSTSGATASSPAACSTTSRACAAPTTSTPGAPVHGWELADAAAAQGVDPAAGDAVLIRSGHGPTSPPPASARASAAPPGVHASCIEFLARHRGRRCSCGTCRTRPSPTRASPNPVRLADAAARAPHPAPVHGHAHPRQRRLRGAGGRLRRRRTAGSSSSSSRRS